jgi:L-2-hydroxyglutarate oxidase LhgO
MADWTGDIAIIGGGILGLATARELLTRRPGAQLIVLEKEPDLGQHQTGRNSGVIHSGIYYAPGSLKAKLCVAGAKSIFRYCEEKGIPTERCGKLIVARNEGELGRLEELQRRGEANGVPGLEMVGPERIKEIEPHCVGVKALWSPNTGIVNYSLVAAAYADDVRECGGEVRTGYGVQQIVQGPTTTLLVTDQGVIETKLVVACAGLQADRVAAMTGAPRSPRIVPFRGDYYKLRPERAHLCKGMIYPVPDPAFPFLGVHLTKKISGEIWCGPNAVLAFAREGYTFGKINPRDLLEVVTFGGFQRLAAKYWKVGLEEMVRDLSKQTYLESLQEYVPELVLDDLLPARAGVRAQALNDDGTLLDDFVINHSGRVVHVRNAPSPAATSSQAIATMIADAVEERAAA